MNEKLLQFIWINRLYNPTGLKTTTGSVVDIVRTGFVNSDCGPDIFGAHVRIDGMLWVGNVEFHVKSSHWRLHQHNCDSLYSNIILHVVFVDDEPVLYPGGKIIPTLVLPCDSGILKLYYSFVDNNNTDTCRAVINNLEHLKITGFLDRLLEERLIDKSKKISNLLSLNKGDWNQTCWQFLARCFGFGKNSDALENLAKSIPFNIINKNIDSLFVVCSIMLGQSGLINDSMSRVAAEYSYQQKKYQLAAMSASSWKTGRLRPANHPINRILQLAAFVCRKNNLFGEILEKKTVDECFKFFSLPQSSVEADNLTIYSIGKQTASLLIINFVVPLIFCYGRLRCLPEYEERAHDLLSQLPAENNSVVDKMRLQGIDIGCAMDSQAVVQLDTFYCKNLRCIDCQIGRYALYFADSFSNL